MLVEGKSETTNPNWRKPKLLIEPVEDIFVPRAVSAFEVDEAIGLEASRVARPQCGLRESFPSPGGKGVPNQSCLGPPVTTENRVPF